MIVGEFWIRVFSPPTADLVTIQLNDIIEERRASGATNQKTEASSLGSVQYSGVIAAATQAIDHFDKIERRKIDIVLRVRQRDRSRRASKGLFPLAFSVHPVSSIVLENGVAQHDSC